MVYRSQETKVGRHTGCRVEARCEPQSCGSDGTAPCQWCFWTSVGGIPADAEMVSDTGWIELDGSLPHRERVYRMDWRG